MVVVEWSKSTKCCDVANVGNIGVSSYFGTVGVSYGLLDIDPSAARRPHCALA